MGARNKLNTIAISGCLLIAGFIGAICGSWLVFAIAFTSALALALTSREIRPRSRRR